METKLSTLLNSKGGEVQRIQPTATVIEAVRTMNESRIGSLLVMNNDEVVGIFTERDVLTRILDSDLDPHTTAVADVMTSDLVTIRPTATIEEAMAVVTEKRCRHLPVMDGNVLLGLVSSGDLTRWMTRNQAIHIQDLVNYITRKYPA